MTSERHMRARTTIVLLLFLTSCTPSELKNDVSSHRIVSLAPSVTETLFALGAEAEIVGICTFCDFPRAVEKIARVGSYSAPSIEAIVAKKPDVVIGVPPNNPEAIATLRQLGMRVVVVEVDTIEQIRAAIRTIAHEAGRIEQGEALLRDMDKRMEVIRGRLQGAPQRRVLMVVGQEPLIAVGSGIFLNELITQAQGVNIAADARQPWVRLSLEVAIAKQPEVIIDGSMGSEEDDKARYLGLWQNFPTLPAVRDGRVHGTRSYTVLRPGPRLPEGFEEIARLIQPERFQ
jgi:iron complex transport system substrate-binding protein